MSRIRDIANILSGGSSAIATDSEIPSFVAGKNKIINGDFSVWQRGTSFSNPGGVYTADRWDLSYDGSGTTRTVSRQAFTPGAAPVSGYEAPYFYRYSRSGGTNGTVDYLLRQRVEDVRTLAGQTATVSFWAKADANRSMGLDFFQIFGTGGSSNVYVGVGTYNLTTSWQRFTTTVNIPSINGKTINNADSSLLLSYYVVSSNATWTIDIWGVQLEAGSIATPFTLAGGGSQQAELSLCQRYYWKATTATTLNGIPTVGFAIGQSTTTANAWIRLPVSMRGNGPSSIDVANPRLYSSAQFNPTTVTLANATPDESQLSIIVSGGGLVQNQVYNFGHDNGAGSYIAFSAEF